jgi:hypothetical protein
MIGLFYHFDDYNKLSSEERYFLTTLTFFYNRTKLFLSMAIPFLDPEKNDEILAKKFFELILIQCSNIYEIIDSLTDDFLLLCNKYLSKELNETLLELHQQEKSQKCVDIQILKDIRTKYSFHIPKDDYFILQTKDTTIYSDDLLIAHYSSEEEKDFFFNMDFYTFSHYIDVKYHLSDLEFHKKLKEILYKYTDKLLLIFNKAIFELLAGHCYTTNL